MPVLRDEGIQIEKMAMLTLIVGLFVCSCGVDQNLFLVSLLLDLILALIVSVMVWALVEGRSGRLW